MSILAGCAPKCIDAGPASEYRDFTYLYGFTWLVIPQHRTYKTQTWRVMCDSLADSETYFVATPAGYEQGGIRHTIAYETPLPAYMHDEMFVQPVHDADWLPTVATYTATT